MIATLGALAATVVLGLLRLVNPVADEWQCVQGEAPAVTAEGGRACFREGSALPPGYAWERSATARCPPAATGAAGPG